MHLKDLSFDKNAKRVRDISHKKQFVGDNPLPYYQPSSPGPYSM
jgi:hypothetical protein